MVIDDHKSNTESNTQFVSIKNVLKVNLSLKLKYRQQWKWAQDPQDNKLPANRQFSQTNLFSLALLVIGNNTSDRITIRSITFGYCVK